MKSAAMELGQYNITVNALIPGLVDTPLTRYYKRLTESIAETGQKRPSADATAGLRTRGRPPSRSRSPARRARRDLAGSVFLASDAAAMVTGAEYEITGGDSIATSRRRSRCSSAFASSHSASIASRPSPVDPPAPPGRERLDPPEAALELGVGRRAARPRARRRGGGRGWPPRTAGRPAPPRAAARVAAPAISASSSAISSCELVEHGLGRGQSKPTRAARFCSLSARVRAGRPSGHLVERARRAACAALAARSAALLASQRAVCAAAVAPAVRAEDVRVAADHLVGDRRAPRRSKSKAPRLLGHPGVEDHLQQQVAELAPRAPPCRSRSMASATS